MPGQSTKQQRRVAILTLGCARNEVDSEELAGRLADEGWTLVADTEDADAVLVNTCGFIDAAKKESIDTVLAARASADEQGKPQAVVAVGCLAERYGNVLAGELPEADAVLGFDDYPAIAARLTSVLDGDIPQAHEPGRSAHLAADQSDRAPRAAGTGPRGMDATGSPNPLGIRARCQRQARHRVR